MTYLRTAFLTQIRLALSLRFAFLLKLASILVRQGLVIVMWGLFFNRYITVEGWHFGEMLAMYGLIAFGIGCVEMLFYGLRDLPFLIETNQLDYYITQPKNLLLNIALSKGDISAFSEIFYGLILLGLSGYLTSDTLRLLLLLPIAILFIFSLYLYVGSVAFYVKNAPGFIRELFSNANIIATQPNSAYSGLFKLFTLTFLPVAYISFFPIEYLRTHTIKTLGIAYLGTSLFFIIACQFFYLGIRRYESGNLITYKY